MSDASLRILRNDDGGYDCYLDGVRIDQHIAPEGITIGWGSSGLVANVTLRVDEVEADVASVLAKVRR